MPHAPRDPRRSDGRGGLRAAAATCAAGLALAPALLSAPALALGEDGPFDLPLTISEISVSETSETRVDLTALVEDSAEAELDLDTARLAVPESAPAELRERMSLDEDGTALTVAGEGVWSIEGRQLVFQPDPAPGSAASPVALTIGSVHETRSLPAEIRVTAPDTVVQRVRASAGEVVTVRLQEQDPRVIAGGQRLQLDGLPAGSTVTRDGSRVVVPKQGTWQLSEDRLTLTYTPRSPRLGYQPTPVSYAVRDASGAPSGAGTVTVVTPVIPDMKRSAQYGEPIVFTLAEGMQNISPDTLELALLSDASGATLSEDRTRATVPGQGSWYLDRDEATVTFTPESAEVTVTAPMGVTGGDGEGATSARALLDTSYPIMADLELGGVHGSPVVFDLSRSSAARDVRLDSMRLSARQMPPDATLAEDGLTLRVPGQGTWSADPSAQTVTFTPASSEPGMVVSPVVLEVPSLYADNLTTATLSVQYGTSAPTMRDDEVRTVPGEAVTADVLANDTPGGVGQPFQPASLRLRSMDAVNLGELENWTGTRLEIPDQGVFSIDSDGVLSFDPAEGFVGRTTSIDYLVTDAEGIVSVASFSVEVDPKAESTAASPQDTAGINTMLAGLLPSSASTAVVFGAVIALTVFAGGVMLWIGTRMEVDRRTWKD